jgi:hypothetical protein
MGPDARMAHLAASFSRRPVCHSSPIPTRGTLPQLPSASVKGLARLARAPRDSLRPAPSSRAVAQPVPYLSCKACPVFHPLARPAGAPCPREHLPSRQDEADKTHRATQSQATSTAAPSHRPCPSCWSWQATSTYHCCALTPFSTRATPTHSPQAHIVRSRHRSPTQSQ